MSDKELYLEAFVGKKYQKISKCKFSVFSFLFGSLHWAYRKMIIEALIVCVITNIINALILLLTSNFIIMFVVSILMGVATGFAFPVFYKKYINRQVEKILETTTASNQETMIVCQRKGGTSILFLILAMIICGMISGKIMSISSNKIEDNVYRKIKFSDSQETTNNNSEFFIENEGYSISLPEDDSINLEEFIEVQIPKEFEEKTRNSQYCYKYEYEEIESREEFGEGAYSIVRSCNIEICVVSSIYIASGTNEITSFEDFEKMDVDTKVIAGKEWYFLKYGSTIEVNHIYATLIDEDKPLFIKWNMRGELDVCKEDLDEILSSIKILDERNYNNESSEDLQLDEQAENLVISSEDLKLENIITYEIPDMFEASVNSETKNIYEYYTQENDEEHPECFVEISVDTIEELKIYGYENAEDCLFRIASSKGIEDDIYSVELNGIEWHIVGYQNDDGIVYCNFAQYNDIVIAFTYQIAPDVTDENANQYYEDIINSIEIMEQE